MSKPSDLIFDIVQSSENTYDYLIISNIDSSAKNTTTSGLNFCNWKGKTSGTTAMTIPDSKEHFVELMYRKDSSQSSGSDNVKVTLRVENEMLYDDEKSYEIWREIEICSNVESGNIEYRNPTDSCDCIEGQKEWRFNDEYVCGEDVGQTIGMKYEVWREWKICELDGSETETGNIEYRNPKKSDDCTLVVYQWREEDSDVCGSALPDNTTEVSEAPDLNVDF